MQYPTPNKEYPRKKFRRAELATLSLEIGNSLLVIGNSPSAETAEYPTPNKAGQSPMSSMEYPIMKGRKFDLQDRLIDFSVRMIRLSEAIPESKAGKHICLQLLRSGTSPAPNYVEAQSAESNADFIHKLKIALKELRETEIWLKIIAQAELIETSQQLVPLLKETDELIAILFKSVETAQKNKETHCW